MFHDLINIANASARVILSFGLKAAFVRDTRPPSAPNSTARQIQSLLRTSEKYHLH
jgi:hypothetical protein